MHQEVWRETHCLTCFQPDEMARRLHGEERVCPIWARAMRSDRKPVAWKRNTRAKLMTDTYTCEERVTRPALARHPKQRSSDEDVPMFDLEPHEIDYVPVENWPEKPRKRETDHQ